MLACPRGNPLSISLLCCHNVWTLTLHTTCTEECFLCQGTGTPALCQGTGASGSSSCAPQAWNGEWLLMASGRKGGSATQAAMWNWAHRHLLFILCQHSDEETYTTECLYSINPLHRVCKREDHWEQTGAMQQHRHRAVLLATRGQTQWRAGRALRMGGKPAAKTECAVLSDQASNECITKPKTIMMWQIINDLKQKEDFSAAQENLHSTVGTVS